MGTITTAMLEAVTPRLTSLGFKKRAGGVFTTNLGADCLGWLGLNTAVEHLGGRAVAVLPIIGVRHDPTERLVAELAGQPYHRYYPPTITQPIGQLMVPPRNAAWTVERDDPRPAIDDMVEAIATFGLPFMLANAELDAIRERIAERMHSDHSPDEPYREAAAAAVAGDRDAALTAVERGLHAISSRTDPAAANFQRFAGSLRTHVEQSDRS
jgi:hypothetical protein